MAWRDRLRPSRALAWALALGCLALFALSVATLALTLRLRAAGGGGDGMLADAAILGVALLAGLVIVAGALLRRRVRRDRALQALTATACAIGQQHDLSLRVAEDGGAASAPVRAFNAMLAELERRAQALELAQRAQAQQLREQAGTAAALQDNIERKTAFLATLAHELRNPLAPVRAGLELLRQGGADAAAIAGAAEVMERQMRHLGQLVDDLLDVSHMCSGALALRTGRIELKAVVNDALEAARPYIELHGHVLEISLPDRPVFLNGDAARLAQILSNLLHNAARYTPRGGRVSLCATVDERELELRVADNGIGIDAAMLEEVFVLFAPPDAERGPAGLGVGLPLARHLAQLHGGSIEAHSAGLLQGSQFVVRLPVVVPAAPPSRAAQGEIGAADVYRILLADANVDFVDSIGALLASMGHTVVITNNGADALRAAISFCPDFVFLDIGLPQLSGYDVARDIRAMACGDSTVLVAVTGWSQERDRQLAFESGFDHHMVKPVHVEQVEKILGKRRTASRTPL